MSKWVKSEERLPDDGQKVLVWDGFDYLLAHIDKGHWWFYERDELEYRPITFKSSFSLENPIFQTFEVWMPLPDPPKTHGG